MLQLSLSYLNRQGGWAAAATIDPTEGAHFHNHEIELAMTCHAAAGHTDYELRFKAAFPTRIRLSGQLAGDNCWHLIPCCIHGDNNLLHAKPGQYPNLTYLHPEEKFSSPLWEFRADRASHPVSMLFASGGAAAISINPYSHAADGTLIRNGVFAELPDRFGVTLGYANLPLTFINKYCGNNDESQPSTCDTSFDGSATGKIFLFPESGREAAHKILKELHRAYREPAQFTNDFPTAARAMLDAFVEQNWSEKFQHYTNQECHLPEQPELRPWRALWEIGWTGGSILAYPFITAMRTLRLPADYFHRRKDGFKLFDEIVNCYNPDSGLFFDLTHELNGSRVNGWWDFLKITHDRHAAYTNGQALYYLFRTMSFLCENDLPVSPHWYNTATKVADTLVELQREDGCCGYAFHTDRKGVADWEGFAGAWIVAAMAAAYAFSRNQKYLSAAHRGLEYYYADVKALNCCGSPMDTWKAPDQEGNLPLIRAARILHQLTGDAPYLKILEDAAHYEYLWRYCFRAIPECPPLKGSNWNSCGGSVTSVSNPHIHPMGLLVTEDLYYLAEKTGNDYHRQRAEDGAAWIMNSLELYPETTGYGRYGITTERYCPSDGFTLSRYSDGRPASMWFSYNGWAAANSLEALLWLTEKGIPAH